MTKLGKLHTKLSIKALFNNCILSQLCKKKCKYKTYSYTFNLKLRNKNENILK